jgi:hypothetical protein
MSKLHAVRVAVAIAPQRTQGTETIVRSSIFLE